MIMSPKNYSNVNRKSWWPTGWRNAGMSLQGSDTGMESSKLNSSLLNGWDRGVQRGTEWLDWGTEILSEPQRKAWKYKGRPRGTQACLWGTFCRAGSHWRVFCRRVAEDFWSPSSTTLLLGNPFNKSLKWEQPSSPKTSWPCLLGPRDWSGGGGLTSNAPFTGPQLPCLRDWPGAWCIVTQAGSEEAFFTWSWESFEHRVVLPEDIPLPGRESHFCLEENIQFGAHTEKQKHEPLRERENCDSF